MNGNNWMRGFGGIGGFVPSPRRRLNAKWSSRSTSSSTRKISSTSREIYTQPTTLTELTMSEINGEVFIWVTSSQVPSNQSPGGCIACTGFLSFSFFATFFDGFYLWACFHGLPPSTQSPGCFALNRLHWFSLISPREELGVLSINPITWSTRADSPWHWNWRYPHRWRFFPIVWDSLSLLFAILQALQGRMSDKSMKVIYFLKNVPKKCLELQN